MITDFHRDRIRTLAAHNSSVASASQLPEHQNEQVRQELSAVLDSAAFRGSRRSQSFLRYVVENTLNGHWDLLKERSIGTGVFGRDPAYNTGDDAIVRVGAREVRNRLAQFYLGAPDRPVRIELPQGSYMPEFHWPVTPNASPAPSVLPVELESPLLPPSRWRQRWLKPVVLASMVAALVVWTVAARFIAEDSTYQFWSPVLKSREPVLICVATPVAYKFRGSVHQRFGYLGLPAHSTGEMPINFPHEAVVQGDEIIPVMDELVGFGDAYATGQISALFGKMGKPFEINIGFRTSFAELRRSPFVIIGAFTNEWSARLLDGLHFTFSNKPAFLIRENGGLERQWISVQGSDDGEIEDYALVTRMVDSSAHQPVVLIAGIRNYGTQAASEWVSNPALLNDALRYAPSGWRQRNLQIVLRVKVINKNPGLPQVVAFYTW